MTLDARDLLASVVGCVVAMKASSRAHYWARKLKTLGLDARIIAVHLVTGRLEPDFKTIADFRHESGVGIRNVCPRFVAMCRKLTLFSQVIVAIDGSKFKAVNNRDKNFTQHKLE